MIGYSLIKSWLSSDKSAIWSPLTMINITLIYYIILPSLGDKWMYGAGYTNGQHLFYVAAVLFYLCVLLGFSIKQKERFKKWNYYLSENNSLKIGLILFIIALVCYVPFRGFRSTIWAEDAYRGSTREGLISYFIDLISLFCTSCGILYMYYKAGRRTTFKARKSWAFYVVLYFTLVFFIVGGFRYRIVWLILSLGTIYHLFPRPRKINYLLMGIVAVVAFLGFAIMDTARTYGVGIDRDVATSMSLVEASEGAGENVDVCCFSIAAIDCYNRTNERCYFEPIVTAILMPIPRAIFPSKPDGSYMREVQMRTFGDASGGAAFLCFAEAFISFGWFGIVIYGLFLGWLSKVFWDNYRRNHSSMGAILLLGLYNGFCYDWVSRGYLGGNFNDFIYFVILPFWIIALLRKTLPNIFNAIHRQ